MLTSDQSIVVYERGRAYPDRLRRRTHGHYQGHAERMLTLYRQGIGRKRRELHRDVEALFAGEPDCEVRRIRAFCKLLDDESVYDSDTGSQAAALRLRVFALAAPFHPLVSRPDALFDTPAVAVKEHIARELSRPWPEIEEALYMDVIDQQRLLRAPGYDDGGALLSRYNVAQLQACLYRARAAEITASTHFKAILRHVKLAGLMHEIESMGDGRYRIRLSGPTSALRTSRRYGVSFARMIPGLLACDQWELDAVVETPRGTATLRLTSWDGYRGHLVPPEEYDSTVEAGFARRFGEMRAGWRPLHEAAILHDGQTTFVPDFLFRHEDGTEVYFEIVGYWTPEYLEKRRQTLQRFSAHQVMLAVPERSLKPGVDAVKLMPDVVVYKAAIKPSDVLAALEIRRGAPLKPV